MNARAILVTPTIVALLACAACAGSAGVPQAGSVVLPPNQVLEFNLLFTENCAGCHGPDGKGGAAIALANPVFLAIGDDAVISAAAANGVPKTPMPPFSQNSGGMLTCDKTEPRGRSTR